MVDVTVRQLAKTLQQEPDHLLKLLRQAGLPQERDDEIVTDQQKIRFLDFVENRRGTESATGQRKIAIRPPERVQGPRVTRTPAATTTVPQPNDQLPEDDGLEAEDATTIKRPFDPQKIKVTSTTLLIGQMITRIAHGEMTTPKFQRKAGIWNARRKSRLVESLLLRIPIPVFYFAADEDDNWSVVDGLQRTTTIRDFVAGEFALQGLEYLTKYDGRRYHELPRPMQRRIDETTLMVNVIQPGTPEEVTFNIFSRINTGGMTLTGQEIRHALHKGPVLDFLEDLAGGDPFLQATGGTINPQRMGDRECVLRFIAFRDRRWTEYGSADDLDRWLGDAMTDINRMTDTQRKDLRETFEGAMLLAHEIFGAHAFRKRYGPDDRKRPVNKALFEAWGAGLAGVIGQKHRLVAKRKRLVVGFHELMNQQDFDVSVSAATGTASKVQRRFGAIEGLIEECLRC